MMRIAIRWRAAGLYFALMMKQQDPAHAVTVIERDGPDDTFGWGIASRTQTFDYLRDSDAPAFERITLPAKVGQRSTSSIAASGVTVRGNRFSASRGLPSCACCRTVAASLVSTSSSINPLTSPRTLSAYDLLVGADGANSPCAARTNRSSSDGGAGPQQVHLAWNAAFVPCLTRPLRRARTRDCSRRTLTSSIARPARHRRMQRGNAGAPLASMARTIGDVPFPESCCRSPARASVAGQELRALVEFSVVRNAHWHGTRSCCSEMPSHAHFSIGSGTKLALEDAICWRARLPKNLSRRGRCRGLRATSECRPRGEQYQQAALRERRWFEDVADTCLEPLPFAVKAMTRSRGSISDKLRHVIPIVDATTVESIAWLIHRIWNPKNETMPREGCARCSTSS